MQLKQIIARSVVVAGLVFAGNWTVDSAKSKVNFSVKGPFGTVHGNFTGLKAKIEFNEKDGSGSVSASIDAKTVSSGVSMRNKHLTSEEQWLNVAKYPEITYHSKKIEKSDKGFKAIGELTLKGVTKPVEIPFTFTPQGGGGVFKGQFKIKREDYKLGKPGGSVGDEITIDLEIVAKK
jgi:polyisoprenoid-binding protein YceI